MAVGVRALLPTQIDLDTGNDTVELGFYAAVARLVEDASTPAIVTSTGTTNPTTAFFSPPAQSLLVALVGGGWGTVPTSATVSDTGGHAWTVGSLATGSKSGAGGMAMIAYTYLSTAPGSINVKATFANLSGGSLLAVRVLDNALVNQLGAGSGTTVSTSSTSGAATLTTTASGSLVYGISDDAGNNDVFTANGSTTALSGGAYNDSTDHISLAAWKASALTVTPGSVTLGGTWAAATPTAVAALEVLPSSAAIVPLPTMRVFSQAVQRAACF